MSWSILSRLVATTGYKPPVSHWRKLVDDFADSDALPWIAGGWRYSFKNIRYLLSAGLYVHFPLPRLADFNEVKRGRPVFCVAIFSRFRAIKRPPIVAVIIVDASNDGAFSVWSVHCVNYGRSPVSGAILLVDVDFHISKVELSRRKRP